MTLPADLSAALDALGVREPEPEPVKPVRQKLLAAKFREFRDEF